jgi:hypothetical protein
MSTTQKHARISTVIVPGNRGEKERRRREKKVKNDHKNILIESQERCPVLSILCIPRLLLSSFRDGTDHFGELPSSQEGVCQACAEVPRECCEEPAREGDPKEGLELLSQGVKAF